MDSLTLSKVKSKTHIKATVTRLKKYIKVFDASQSSQYDITERKQKLIDLWNQFETIQSHIEIDDQDPSIIDKITLLKQKIQQRASFEASFSLMSQY